MEKANLKITENGQYKNLQLKPYKGVGGLEDGQYVDIMKTKYVETKEIVKTNWTGYSATFEYEGEECSTMFFDKSEADAYNMTGGLGDVVRVSAYEEKVVNKQGMKVLVTRLKFEKL